MAKQSYFDKALEAEGVSGSLADVARSIFMQESGGGRNTKTSNAGAVGGMQIVPSTFAGVADKGWDISNPEHNARAGIRYLKQLDKQAGGDPLLLAAGYYGGPGGMEKARKGIAVSDPRNPHAPNTLQYAQQVVGRLPTKGRQESPVVVAAVPSRSVLPFPAVDTDPAPVGEAIPESAVVTPWQDFQNAAPMDVTPADLAFNVKPMRMDPMPYIQAIAAPDFSMFRPLKGRA